MNCAPRIARAALAVLVGCGLLLHVGCSGVRRGPAVPLELTERALVLGNPAVRTFTGGPMNKEFLDEILRAGMVEVEAHRKAGTPLPPADYLCISGGGANGAFGAGILCGWTKQGSRPQFKLVTGVSTGALTAPFAFLGGKEYDDKLKSVYTTVTTDEICTSRGILAVLADDAMMSTKPLHGLIAKLVDDEMIQHIAQEYRKGRILMVGTTDLDAMRGVIWNIGLLATMGTPESATLIRGILLASAAIPAAFPPVMFDVEVDGKKYQEMHVDGGATAQVFLYPVSFNLEKVGVERGIARERRGYIIRNSLLTGTWADVERLTLPIAGRAITSLIQMQGVGDLFRIFLTCRRDGVAFNLAYIPEDFKAVPKEDFDPAYMTLLFDVGYKRATQPSGYPWSTFMPGFEDVTIGAAAPASAAAQPAAR